MPFYPYRCDDCGRNFEIKKPMSECSSVEICPDCSQIIRRTYTAVNFTWGLGGWDYSEGGMGGSNGQEIKLRHHD